MDNLNGKIRLKDISEITGYSITTISHVINKTRHVDESTKRTILTAIEKLGYTPPERRKYLEESRVIGVIISDIRVDYFYEVVKDIEDAAYEQGYHIILMDSEENPGKELNCIHSLLEKKVSGIILAPCNTKADLSFCKDFPIVQIDRKIDEDLFDFVGINHMQSAYSITNELIKDGYKNIGFIGFSNENFTSRERRKGYRTAMLEKGIFNEENVLQIAHDAEGFHDDIGTFLLKDTIPVDSLICCSSNICYEALGAIKQLKDTKFQHIKIYSYDDNKWFDYLDYPVNAVSQPTGDIAIVAIDLLTKKIDKTADANIKKEILLDHTIIRRTAN